MYPQKSRFRNGLCWRRQQLFFSTSSVLYSVPKCNLSHSLCMNLKPDQMYSALSFPCAPTTSPPHHLSTSPPLHLTISPPHHLTTIRILAMCHSVLYKQLSAWMLHGLLLDEQGEFFIEAVKERTIQTEVCRSCTCWSGETTGLNLMW